MPSARIQAVLPSATLRITALAKELLARGEKVFNLAAGEPDFDTPEPVKEAAILAIRQGFTKYTPTTGLPELKGAIADYLQRSRGLSYQPEQIAVTCGAKQAIFNLLQVLVGEGDEVLIPSPYWVSYPEMVRLAGAVPVFVPTKEEEGFRLTAKSVEAALTSRTKCLLLNSPSNPTGAVLSASALREIGALAATKSLWVISDEIYSELIFEGKQESIAHLVPELAAKTIVVDGVSKSFAMTGWRIGFLAGPPEVVEMTSRLQDHSTSNPASISQKAALAALQMPPADLKRMVAEFAARRTFLIERLAKIPKISFAKPDGAFYCFINISQTGLSSSVFAQRILQEAKVAVIPGAGFGWDSHIRVSFAAARNVLEEGLNRLEQFIRKGRS